MGMARCRLGRFLTATTNLYPLFFGRMELHPGMVMGSGCEQPSKAASRHRPVSVRVRKGDPKHGTFPF